MPDLVVDEEAAFPNGLLSLCQWEKEEGSSKESKGSKGSTKKSNVQPHLIFERLS